MITKEPGNVNVGILFRYFTPEGRCHNPHGPAVIYINDEGYEYNLNGTNHNIVGMAVYDEVEDNYDYYIGGGQIY